MTPAQRAEHDRLWAMPEHELGDLYLAAVEAGRHQRAAELGGILDARGQADLDAERARLDHVDALHRSARFYAARGLPVFPLVPEGKLPLTAHGFHDASTDPAVIDAWWTRHPAANIGAPTGIPGLFDVLDIDGAEGHVSMTRFLADGGALPDVLGRQRTARPGGWHHLVPVGTFGPGNRAGLLPGLDVRGAGGYIVVAPSRVGGRRYRWIDVPVFLLPAVTS